MSEKVSLPREGADFIKASEVALKYKLEWFIDPPPWIISVLDERILKLIYQTKLEGLAEIAEIEGKTFRRMSELMQK